MAARLRRRSCGAGAGGVWHGAGGSAAAHSATSAIRVIFVAKKTGASSLHGSHAPVGLLGQTSGPAAADVPHGASAVRRLLVHRRHYGGLRRSAASFTLDCVFSPETGASVTVTEPESIAGIQAQVKDTAASVSYDGMQLGLGSLADGNLAPLAAPYVLGQCWAGSTSTRPARRTAFCARPIGWATRKRELVVDTWFSQEPLAPVRAEISFEGRMVLRTDISAFSMRQPTQLTEE